MHFLHIFLQFTVFFHAAQIRSTVIIREEKVWYASAHLAACMKITSVGKDWFVQSQFARKTAAFACFGIDWHCLSRNHSTQMRLLLILAGDVETNPGPVTNEDSGFPCIICEKNFHRQSEVNRHIKEVHQGIKNTCPTCGRQYSRLSRHIQEVHLKAQKYACDICSGCFIRLDTLKRHKDLKHQPTDGQSTRTEGKILKQPTVKHTTRFEHLALSNMSKKRTATDLWQPWTAKKPKKSLPSQDPMCAPGISGAHCPEIFQLIQSNWTHVRTHYSVGCKFQDIYNIRVDNVSPGYIEELLMNIHRKQLFPYKLNLSVGFILQNRQNQELKFFYASNNTRIFPIPFTILAITDLQQVKEALLSEDLLEHCRIQRPDSKYTVAAITNLMVYVTKIKSFPIGCPIDLPESVKNNHAIIGLDRNYRTGRRYTDNFCFFRSLALHLKLGKLKDLEEPTQQLVNSWCQQKNVDIKKFQGVLLDHIPELEKHFKLNIEVYSLTRDSQIESSDDGDINEILIAEYEEMEADGNGQPLPQKVYRSVLEQSGTPMYLNLCAGHFSYITSIQTYCQRWQCAHCLKFFPHHGHWDRHQKTCNKVTTYKYPGGGYGLPKTIFQELMEEGFIVPEEDQFYPYRVAFDFEAYFEQVADPGEGKLRFTQQLKPASVSVASNVTGYTEPWCFISNGDPQELIVSMYDYLCKISEEAHDRLKQKFHPIIEDITSKIDNRDSLLRRSRQIRRRQPELSECLENEAKQLDKYEYLMKKFDKWLRQLIVLGFNSGKFDCNLIRKYLVGHLVENGILVTYVVKKGNSYMSIALENLHFLDIINYLAAGTSYSKWLKGFDIPEQKGWWPYEWFTSLTLLNQTYPPVKSDFYSSLNQKEMTDTEYQEFLRLWNTNGFSTMRELLVWYNNLDVVPFLSATEKMANDWKLLGIDMFKGGGISLPGLAMIHMFKTIPRHNFFTLWNEKTKDYHKLIRDNIVGGPAIVFTRYHEVNKTKIRGEKLVKKIIGHDANSLYLYALMKDMPTGIYAIWKSENDDTGTEVERIPAPQKPCDPCTSTIIKQYEDNLGKLKDRWLRESCANLSVTLKRQYGYTYSKSELEWLEWTANINDIHIQHRFNGGQKTFHKNKRAKYPVDGYAPAVGIIYQFHGCKWHGHGCLFDPYRGQQSSFEARHKTTEITKYIESLGYRVIEKWECDWRQERKADAVKKFLKKHLTLDISFGQLTATQILSAVQNKFFFGMVECDIEIPTWDIDLMEKFKDLPPIFKNADVSINDIGPFMSSYCRQNKLLTKPRRNLISSYFGRKILVATPLLQWYLEKGLRVSRVYQAIQFKPQQPFEHLGEEVANDRRLADQNPAHKIKADMSKARGNSFYGKCMTDVTKHLDVKYFTNDEVSTAINDPLFRKLEQLSDSAYEVSMAKKKIEFRLPTNIAYFVYSYAKLRMLEFVYDFLAKFFDSSDYDLISMDTDSMYAAYSSADIDSLVKADLKTEYFSSTKESFLAVSQYDQRTPGLFKEEWRGDGMIALCSKTYYTWENDMYKMSCKGLSKKTNNFNRSSFMSVLDTKIAGSGTNHGFRVKGPDIFQYIQERSGLSYLYIKRKVSEDGVSTVPLDI